MQDRFKFRLYDKAIGEMGYSINKIAKIYGCDWSTVKQRIYENPELLEDKQ